MIVSFGLFGILVVLYAYSRRKLSYFMNMGVIYELPLPFLNNFGTSFIRGQHLLEPLKELYELNPNERFVGMFEFLNPIIVLRDLELIKTVTVKEYDNFLNHRILIDEHNEPLFGRSLFTLKGDKWRHMRATLSPAFTSSKMRNMFSFLADCADNVTVGLAKEIDNKNISHLDVEVKDLFTRYANDVIGSCAFGLQVNSMEDRDNYFYRLGKTVSTINFAQMFKFFGYSSIRTLMKWLKVRMFDKKVTNYFRELVLSNMKERDEKNILRPDMIHLLMEAKKGNLKHETKSTDQDAGFATVDESHVGELQHKIAWEDDDLVAQALIFFVAGFDTAYTAMKFATFELAVNIDIQKKLQVEIDETLQKNNGKINYGDLQEMNYLDMVVSETLRKWPPVVLMDRQSLRAFNVGKPRDNEPCQDVYGIPFSSPFTPFTTMRNIGPTQRSSIPRDSQPRTRIVPFSYLPFGTGPRNCIRSRFALMEVKVMLVKLFSKFDVTPGSKTDMPLFLESNTFNLRGKKGRWLRLSKR